MKKENLFALVIIILSVASLGGLFYYLKKQRKKASSKEEVPEEPPQQDTRITKINIDASGKSPVAWGQTFVDVSDKLQELGVFDKLFQNWMKKKSENVSDVLAQLKTNNAG